jgi:mono/diheme cytochrome c family protein
MRIGLLAFMVLACAAKNAAAAEPLTPESRSIYENKIEPFLQANCYKCHDDKKTLAGLRLDTLGTDFLSGKTADVWKEIYDRVGNGTMPPKKQPRPDPKATADVAEWITLELRNAEKRAKGSAGRIPTRRLNRTEYANTLRDLLYLDENVARALEQELPMDGKVDGFDRGGAGLYIDESQLAKYLELAELVLSREVFGLKPKQTAEKTNLRKTLTWNPAKYEAKFIDLPAYPNDHPLRNSENVKVPLGANYADFSKPNGFEFIGNGYHGEGGLDFFGGWISWGHPWRYADFADGWYRVKIRAGAFKGSGKYELDAVKVWLHYAAKTPLEAREDLVIDAPLDQPKEFEAKVFLRAGARDVGKSLRLGWNGGMPDLVIQSPEMKKIEKDWREVYYSNMALFTKKPPPTPDEIAAAKKKYEEKAQIYRKQMQELKVYNVFNPEIDLKAIPRLWIESVELEGPLDPWPPKGRTELFFDGEKREVDGKYIREIFERFLPRAYRRPVEVREIDDLVAWVLEAQKTNKLTGAEAVREGVKLVLCSPAFLLLQEPAGVQEKARKLTDHELACRLSYYLWSTMPDAELFQLADRKQLHDPKVLEAQVRRMLADPRGSNLVRNFTGQWLKVREFSGVVTDRGQYRAYDDSLRDASWKEPYEFFTEVLRGDLSILNFLDSDFVVINDRLAAHYGLEGVRGSAFRKVAIRPEHHRGGILGMAGVLTYLTDGLRTLPVRRAAYVLDTLWNSPPPPPPPNVGNLPPVGKALTVRERLEQHRNSDSCASCHARIDPFGIALENYDAIGAWRERQNGERFRGDKNSPPIDVHGVLPDGREFKDLREYKQALLAEKERFVRAFVEKMLTYALGRPVGATDRGTIDEIIGKLEAGKTEDRERYRLQALIQAIVASQVFQMK